jgi:hypothetical protein
VGSPAAAKLVTINTASGIIAEIGSLPEDSDAITYAAPVHEIGDILATMSGRTLALFALIAGLILAVIGMLVVTWIRRR